jgi:alpha-amylase
VAAGLSFLMGGVPCMYYGQEIGMMAKPLNTGTDGDGIPSSEAYEWYASGEGEGMANWYKDVPQIWDNRSAAASDGVSLEEQQKDTNSLWAYYKQLIRMKKMVYPVAEGKYEAVRNNNDKVISFVRNDGKSKVFVMINLSDKEQQVRIDDASTVVVEGMQLLVGTPNVAFGKGSRNVQLTPYCVQVWKCIY